MGCRAPCRKLRTIQRLGWPLSLSANGHPASSWGGGGWECPGHIFRAALDPPAPALSRAWSLAGRSCGDSPGPSPWASHSAAPPHRQAWLVGHQPCKGVSCFPATWKLTNSPKGGPCSSFMIGASRQARAPSMQAKQTSARKPPCMSLGHEPVQQVMPLSTSIEAQRRPNFYIHIHSRPARIGA